MSSIPPAALGVHTILDRVRALAERGEDVLATVEAIRGLVRHREGPRADLLNDLGVLRLDDEDRVGAVALLEQALKEDPRHELARENLAAARSQLDASKAGSVDASLSLGVSACNPWLLKGLETADALLRLRDREVLEVGGCAPKETTRGFGVRRWTACDLRAPEISEPDYRTLSGDAGKLPVPAESFDAAFSMNAFEHFDDVGAVLAETHRVVRAGGGLFAQFSPIWSSSLGHHLWISEEGRTLFTFNDRVLPPWGHLLLDEPEVLALLSITRGVSAARRAAYFIWHGSYINRVTEGSFRRLVEASPWRVEGIKSWAGPDKLTPELKTELERRWPAGGDFSVIGLRWLLRKD